jgi:uncharacterized protein YydD (DUF2326 family)
VSFRPQGLSLIISEQKSDRASRSETYNGTGKSLLLALLHFCLGSNRNEGFEKHLKGWQFQLTIATDGKEHQIVRSADHSNDITVDGEDASLKDLRLFLANACFSLDPKEKHLSFRSLISRFIRSGREAYNEFSYADEGEQKKPFEPMLRSAFLLGLDVSLARRKYELRNRKVELAAMRDKLEHDPVFADLFAEDTIDLEIAALREHEKSLEEDLRGFRVADDYHEIEQEANRRKRDLDLVRREVMKLEEAISQIDRSLVFHDDLSPARVFQLYEEARIAIPDALRKRVGEVLEFHRALQKRRVDRLGVERRTLSLELDAQGTKMRRMSSDLDEQLRYLSDHRALDEYLAVSQECASLKQRIGRLEEGRAIGERVDREMKTISRDLAEDNIRADEYLDSAASEIEEASAMFRGFASELYGPRMSGLTIRNDSGDNQLRYKIDAHIASDAAEGINEAKIFCYDTTILALRRSHRVEFLAHDSTLFGPIDPRQRLAVFNIADRVARRHGSQYIATLNAHDITSIREQVAGAEEEVTGLFNDDTIVLHLNDDTAAGKLLGIDIDMDYH